MVRQIAPNGPSMIPQWSSNGPQAPQWSTSGPQLPQMASQWSPNGPQMAAQCWSPNGPLIASIIPYFYMFTILPPTLMIYRVCIQKFHISAC